MSWQGIFRRLQRKEELRQQRLLVLILFAWIGGWIVISLTLLPQGEPELLLSEGETWETLATFWPIDL